MWREGPRVCGWGSKGCAVFLTPVCSRFIWLTKEPEHLDLLTQKVPPGLRPGEKEQRKVQQRPSPGCCSESWCGRREKAATQVKMNLRAVSGFTVTMKHCQVTLVVFYKTTGQFLEVLFSSGRAKSHISPVVGGFYTMATFSLSLHK